MRKIIDKNVQFIQTERVIPITRTKTPIWKVQKRESGGGREEKRGPMRQGEQKRNEIFLILLRKKENK